MGVFLVAQAEEWTSMETQVAAEVGTENCWEFEISVPLPDQSPGPCQLLLSLNCHLLVVWSDETLTEVQPFCCWILDLAPGN